MLDNIDTAIGRPANITDERIIEAGQALIKANRNVTGFALRKVVGGGDAKRLKDVWDRHNVSQSVTNAEPVVELPIEVAETLANLTKSLTEKINALAVDLNDKTVKAQERRVADVLRAAGEQQAQAERELADASQAVDELEAILAEERARAGELEKRLAESQAANQTQAVELATLRERLEAVEKSAKAANEQHVAEQEQWRQRLADQKQAAQIVATERDNLKTELTKVQAKAEVAEETHKEERKRTASEIQRTAEKLIKIEGERDHAKMETGMAREETAKLAGQLDAMKTQIAQLMQAISSQQSPVNPKKPAKE
ncbi:kfra protein [Methylomonas methanica]|uniref:Kfra protein n=1 Tax=Methylomonas methanica TaxID=421 RepID=A0A177LWJ4_METMH|nr:DNA-binding protein [Methylomonas methanica]OAH97332.1 kfra protein [Methylomonas methanica]